MVSAWRGSKHLIFTYVSQLQKYGKETLAPRVILPDLYVVGNILEIVQVQSSLLISKQFECKHHKTFYTYRLPAT